jgi:hypothetical protein
MLDRGVEERQQHVEVVDDLADRFGVGGEALRERAGGVDRVTARGAVQMPASAVLAAPRSPSASGACTAAECST